MMERKIGDVPSKKSIALFEDAFNDRLAKRTELSFRPGGAVAELIFCFSASFASRTGVKKSPVNLDGMMV